MPNEQGLHDDDRETVERAFWQTPPCMKNCKPDVKIIGRARALGATPAADSRQRGVD
jgi:cytochrome c